MFLTIRGVFHVFTCSYLKVLSAVPQISRISFDLVFMVFARDRTKVGPRTKIRNRIHVFQAPGVQIIMNETSVIYVVPSVGSGEKSLFSVLPNMTPA